MAAADTMEGAAARSSLVLNLEEAQVAEATGEFVDDEVKKEFGEMFFGMLQDAACVLGSEEDQDAEQLRRITVKFQSATYVATLVDRMAYIVRTGGEGADGDGEGRES